MVSLMLAMPPAWADGLDAFAFDQKPGAQLPLDAMFSDAAGRPVSIGSLGGMPLVLAFGYFHCPNLCGVVREDMFAALQRTGLEAGRDYQLAFVSIDPHETPKDAAEAQANDLARYPAGADGWHFLTGDAASIETVEAAAGYHSRYDQALAQFLHPAGLVFATPAGVVSGYLLGVGYSPGDVQAGLARAARGEIGQKASPILLLCFHFDPTTGRYTLAIVKVLRIAGVVTVLGIGAIVLAAHRRRRFNETQRERMNDASAQVLPLATPVRGAGWQVNDKPVAGAALPRMGTSL